MEDLITCVEEQPQPPSSLPNSWTNQHSDSAQRTDEEPKAVGGFVLVHAGAGYHSESKAKEYKHVCKRACQRAVERLRAGALAMEAVAAALVELEDSPFTNAGMGSNLNLSGEIECDASIMDGKSLHYGSVGAIRGIKNPVLVAHRLLSEAQKGKLSAGRIPPCFLVGRGAHDWAVAHGIPPCPAEKMATKFSLSAYKRNKRKMEIAEKMDTPENPMKRRRQSSETENGSECLDTVGAIVVDQEGNVAAAVSSGGLAMKHPGRVGQAAHYGCGCWAQNSCNSNPYSTAVSTSGCGEHLIRTMLARECSVALQAEDAHQALLDAMQNQFISSPFLASEDRVLGGVIVLRCCRCEEDPPSQDLQASLVEFLWSHSTESMCVGYMSAQDSRAKVSRLLHHHHPNNNRQHSNTGVYSFKVDAPSMADVIGPPSPHKFTSATVGSHQRQHMNTGRC
ncbi:threonine aspartase 1 [Gadus macrocephalus]|uniref:threonine aspartase 1 n=1 Tax=Gadus macrocephalus TaxID=80720 RepID=UPI0028CB992D|nr:threonine aspartase 1 [Gadus macrocephalus]